MIDAPLYQKYQVTTIKHKAQDQNQTHFHTPLKILSNLFIKRYIIYYRVVTEFEVGSGGVFGLLDTTSERDMIRVNAGVSLILSSVN